MKDNFWWLRPPYQDKRCKGPSPERSDGRCHNLAHEEGLCRVHMKLAGKIKVCKACKRPFLTN